jgi:hypothetical protein
MKCWPVHWRAECGSGEHGEAGEGTLGFAETSSHIFLKIYRRPYIHEVRMQFPSILAPRLVIEDDECSHNSDPDLLVMRSEFSKSRTALCVGCALIRHQRLEPDSAMCADLPVYDLAFLQELNEEGPRDV